MPERDKEGLMAANLSPDEWELLLARHYLYADGPFGGSPMSYLDATPAELAIACGTGESAEEVARAFVAQFRKSAVKLYLSGETRPSLTGRQVPNFFRYLVLTCFVSTEATGLSLDTNNFRTRLGELFHEDGDAQWVSGVNGLWRALREWSSLRRGEGMPVRHVDLPNPGTMVLIGIAVKMTFPAWRDRAAFEKILLEMDHDCLSHPRRLTDQLVRPQTHSRIPAAIQTALAEFHGQLRAGHTLLTGHRFWTLVQSIAAEREADGPTRATKWRLELRLGGYDQDIPEFVLVTGLTRREMRTDLDGGSWIQLLEALNGSRASELKGYIKAGALVLRDEGGVWVADGTQATEGRTVVLAKGSSTLRQILQSKWTPLDDEWAWSSVLDAAKIPTRQGTSDRLRILTLADGVKMDRSTYLGLPAFLPQVVAPPLALITVESIGKATGSLRVGSGKDPRPLTSTTRVDGAWRISAAEGPQRADIVTQFESVVPEIHEFQTLSSDRGWSAETEMIPPRYRPVTSTSRFGRADGNGNDAATMSAQVGEAIYSRGGRGWTDAELIQTLQPALPDARMAWDVIRSFAENGWISGFISGSWRARRWVLNPPRICRIAPTECAVEGAIAAAALERLMTTVARLGGSLQSRRSAGAIGPSVVHMSNVDPAALGRELEWPVVVAEVAAERSTAKALWVSDSRTPQGRSLASTWDFERALFREASTCSGPIGAISVERWVRDRGDDSDVYVTNWPGGSLTTLSRTAAVLEGHRRSQIALFESSGDALVRTGYGGHLPIVVARTLSLTHGLPSGPVLRERGWTYSYPVDGTSRRWLRCLFGGAIEGGMPRMAFSVGQEVVWKRRPDFARRPGRRLLAGRAQ